MKEKSIVSGGVKGVISTDLCKNCKELAHNGREHGVCKAKHISICMTRRCMHSDSVAQKKPLASFVIRSVTRFSPDKHSRSSSECYLITVTLRRLFIPFNFTSGPDDFRLRSSPLLSTVESNSKSFHFGIVG